MRGLRTLTALNVWRFDLDEEKWEIHLKLFEVDCKRLILDYLSTIIVLKLSQIKKVCITTLKTLQKYSKL